MIERDALLVPGHGHGLVEGRRELGRDVGREAVFRIDRQEAPERVDRLVGLGRGVADVLADEAGPIDLDQVPMRSRPIDRYISARSRATVVLPVPGLPRKTRCLLVGTSARP